jgi:ABC-type polysaccharide/polyol phosphate transport system ATPase subunit
VSALPPGAIRVRGVARRYRVVHERNLTVKEAVLRRRRTRSDEFWALRGVDLDIAPGESVGLVGRNGSGKSTLLKLIAGIMEPTEGTVESAGVLASMLELGAGFHPDFSGRENLYLNASILGIPNAEIDERFEEIVRFAEVEDFIEAPVRTYSSGMQMRLAFAVASHVHARILLLDEVFAVGDEAFQLKCQGRMHEFKRGGGTLVFVSHDAAAIERICDRVVLLERGRVVADGATREVMPRYHRLLSEQGDRGAAGHAVTIEEPATRWGNGRMSIGSVRLLGAGGTPVESFQSGERLVVEIAFSGADGVPPPNVGVMVHAADGTLCFGTNTVRERFGTAIGGGGGIVRLVVPRLPLHEGRFAVTVALSSHDEREVYDWCDRWVEFSVFASGRGIGMVDLAPVWETDGPTAPPPSRAPAAGTPTTRG